MWDRNAGVIAGPINQESARCRAGDQGSSVSGRAVGVPTRTERGCRVGYSLKIPTDSDCSALVRFLLAPPPRSLSRSPVFY